MDKEVVIELIQNNFTKEKLVVELRKILEPKNREKLFLEYFELEKILGGKGASKKVAKSIYERIKN